MHGAVEGENLSQRGPEISLHAGFIRAGTCDASTRGTACGVAAPDQFVRSEWCNTITNFNYGGGLGDAFACMGDLGAADCGPAQPLAAAVGWLAAWPRAGWEGFLRPDALLMVVVIAASDDPSDASGSPTPVQFANALKALKPDPSMVMATVIGPTGCDGDDIVDPRLREFVNQFGANGLYISVCGGSLGAVFDRAITFVGDPAPPCLRGLRDTDLATPGLQASCVAERHSLAPDHSIQNTPLPLCDDGPPPCLRLAPGGGFCADSTFVWVEPAADWCQASAMNFTVECLGCTDANDPACAPAR